MESFAEALDRPVQLYRDLAERVRACFERFVNDQTGGLYDVLDGSSGNDAAIRPNQILAVSLPFSPLQSAVQARVVRLCGERLLTTYGLRSLSPEDANYQPRYSGDRRQRDGAYHQGTVWAWLLGHFALAEYRVFGDADLAQGRLAAMHDHLFDAGLGTISEVFEAEPPHLPAGAPSQAWSVACVIAAWWRIEQAKGLAGRS